MQARLKLYERARVSAAKDNGRRHNCKCLLSDWRATKKPAPFSLPLIPAAQKAVPKPDGSFIGPCYVEYSRRKVETKEFADAVGDRSR